jgi:hypothetical protein
VHQGREARSNRGPGGGTRTHTRVSPQRC